MGKIDYKAIYDKNKHDWYAMTENPQKYEALLAGHYSDSNHFVYELLQNAEDERASKVVIEYYDDKLVFYHNGDSFDEADVKGVSSMLMGTKNRDDAQTIGRFGMGFKSVFKYTYQPEIYSDDEAFVIKSYLLPEERTNSWDFRTVKENLEYPEGGTVKYCPFKSEEHLTKIVIPFKKKDADGNLYGVDGADVLEKLRSLSGEILLFLTFIRNLYWINESTGHYVHIICAEEENDKNMVVCRIRGTEYKKEEITRYLKYKDVFDHPEMRNAEVCVAYKLNAPGNNINEVDESPVWVYFPTRDMTDLPFLIHGSFETAVSREKLMTPSAFNSALFDRLGNLIAESMKDLAKRKLITQNFIRRILINAFADEEENGTIPGLQKKITQIFLQERLIPDKDGNYKNPTELRLPVPFEIANFTGNVIFRKSLENGKAFVAISNEREQNFTEYFSWLRNELKIDLYTLADWSKDLAAIPNVTVKPSGEYFDAMKEFYGFLSDNRKSIYETHLTYTRSGPYEAAIRGCLDSAWDTLKQARVIVNAEGHLASAYNGTEPVIYLNSSSKYRKVMNSAIVMASFAKDFELLMKDGFQISEFDNFQFVKEKVLKKYIIGTDGNVAFENPANFAEEYVEDLQQIFDLLDTASQEEVKSLLEEAYVIKIDSDEPVFAMPASVYTDESDEGIDLRIYYHPIVDSEMDADFEKGDIVYKDTEKNDFGYYHIDSKFFEDHDISFKKLKAIGVNTSPVIDGARSGRGIGDDYWDALGDFCPYISVDALSDNLEYIERHPEEELACKKSEVILKLLLAISPKLSGKIRRRQRNPYTKDEKASWLLQSLNYEKWLFDKSMELHSPREISRYDLSDAVYHDLPDNQEAFQLLGFAETEADATANAFQMVGAMDKRDKMVMLRQLARELNVDINTENGSKDPAGNGDTFVFDGWQSDEFPIRTVRNPEYLIEHVRQEFFCADPVKYEKVLRQIRTSKSPKIVKAYARGMYTNNSGTCICQMCQKPIAFPEVVEISNFGIEMPQLHLCLCQDCASHYKSVRESNKADFQEEIENAIFDIDIDEVYEDYQIILQDDSVLHFTQTHLAEIKEILNLLEKYGVPNSLDVQEKETNVSKKVESSGSDDNKNEVIPPKKPDRITIVDHHHDKIITYARELNIGMRVHHKKFGDGTITDLTGKAIAIEFDVCGPKNLGLDITINQKLLTRI